MSEENIDQFDIPAFEGWTEPPPKAFNTPSTVLNTVESVVTGEPISNEQKAPRGQVASLYTRTQEEERVLRVEMLRNAVSQGNAPLVQLLMDKPEEDSQSFFKQLDSVIINATEKMVVTNPTVTTNTSPDRMNKQIDKVSKRMSFDTLQSLIDVDIKEASLATYAGEFLSPNLGQGVSITNALKGLNIPTAYYQGRSKDADAVYNWILDLPPEERAEAAYRVYQSIRSGAFTTRLAAATFLADVLNPAATSERISGDALNILGTAFDVADIAGVTKALKYGITKLSKVKALGQLGQKKIITQDAAQALETNQNISALGQTKAQQIDAATSLSVDKVLPSGLSNAPTAIQKRMQDAAKASIDELQNTIKSTGIKQEEADVFLRDMQNKFSSATNPNIVKSSVRLSDDLSEIVGEVVYKPTDSDFFETRSAAQKWMENNGIKGEIVENNKNPGFVIKAEEKENLLARKKQLELELSLEAAKEVAKAKRKKKVPTTKPTEASLEAPADTKLTFETEKGSKYSVFEDGTTQRNKAPRPEHPGDTGIKERTARTIYVDGDASLLSAAGVSGMKSPRVIIDSDGTVSLVWKKSEKDTFGSSSISSKIKFYTEPAVGRSPLELWGPTDVLGREGYTGMHAGNKITKINTSKAVEAPKPLAVAVPKALETSKPRFSAGPLNFTTEWDSLVDKAIYQVGSKASPSKSDLEITSWIKQQTGLDDAGIKAQAKVIRERLKALARSSDAVDTENIKVPGITEVERTAGPVTRVDGAGGSMFSMEPVMSDPARFSMNRVGNVTFSSSVPGEALDFTQKMGKLLGLDEVPIVIVNMADEAAKNPRLASDLVTKTGAKGSYTTSKDGVGIIRINVNPNNRVDYYTTLAHEYGHFFESAFSGQYSGSLKNLFNDFLSSKGVKEIGENDFALVLKMRNYKAADELFEGVQGTFGDYLKKNPNAQKWLNRYDEWFAENFSKWAFTDDIPTSTLGKTFKAITDSIKSLAISLAQRIGIDVGDLNVDRRVESFMREHIKLMGDRAKEVVNVAIPKERLSLNSPTGKLAQELAEVNKKLEEMTDLSESLSAGYVVKQDVREAAGLKAVGSFAAADKQSAMKGVVGAVMGFLDPALRGSKELMQGRYVGLQKESRLRKVLSDIVEEPINALSRKERQRVEATLDANDAETNGGSLTTEYSYTELRGKGLNEKEINAFYSVRLARNILHKIKDGEVALSLRNKGYENVIIDEEGAFLSGFARKVTNAELLARRSNITVYDTVKGKRVKVSEGSPNDVYYEFLEPTLIRNTEHRLVLVNPNSVRASRIDTVVPYRPGEMQRIYEDPFFVRIRMKSEVDDVVEEYETAYKTARTRKEAEGFSKDFYKAIEEHRAGNLTRKLADELLSPWNENIDEFMAKAAAGDFDNVTGAYGHVTRNKEDYLRDYSAFATNARGFTGNRGNKLSKVDKEDRRNTISPFESLQAEITNVSRVASITQWRDAAIQRWFNEVSDFLDPQTRSLGPEKAFFAQTEKGKYIGSDESRKFAQDVEDYVQLQLGMRTKEEQVFEGLANITADSLDQIGAKKGRNWALGSVVRNAAPIEFLRAYNFHMLLGFFNPAQLIVQTQNLVTVTAVSPKHGLQAAKTSVLLRVALASDNEAVWRKMATLDNLSSLGLGDVNEFVETVRAVRRSGILDGINSTSLYTAEEGKYFVFRKNVERVKGASGFFFNRGEEITRLSAFEVARREYIEANPGAMWFNDDGLKAILSRQDDLTQNMTRSNVASYQRGILSIPAQFLQYNLKLLANMAGGAVSNGARGYTRAQSARILATHLVAYGVAYNGLGMFLEELIGGAIPEDWDEEKRLYISQGLMAGLINSVSEATTGEQTALALGQRLGTFGFFSDFINDLSDEDSSFLEVFAGPSIQAAKTVGALYDVGKLWVTSPMDYDSRGITSLQMLMQNSASTLSNATKAYIAMNHYNTLMSRSGKALAQVTNSELFFQAIGIPSAAVSDLNKLYVTKQDYEKRIKELTTEVRLYQLKASDSFAKGDKQQAEQWMTHIQGIMQGVSYEEQKRIIQATRDIRETPMLEKNLSDYLHGAYGPRKPLITEK